jgi:hypothetical protein
MKNKDWQTRNKELYHILLEIEIQIKLHKLQFTAS